MASMTTLERLDTSDPEKLLPLVDAAEAADTTAYCLWHDAVGIARCGRMGVYGGAFGPDDKNRNCSRGMLYVDPANRKDGVTPVHEIAELYLIRRE